MFIPLLLPNTFCICSKEASFMRFMLLNSLINRDLVTFPTPVISSNSDAICRLLRFSRWNVMAKRCTSSCIFVSKRNNSLLVLMPIVWGGNPKRSSLVLCLSFLAKPAIGISRCNSFEMTSLTQFICPMPPSVMIRSGRGS